MSAQDDKQRTRRERIERLRKRLSHDAEISIKPLPLLVAVLKGVLDLLEDEL